MLQQGWRGNAGNGKGKRGRVRTTGAREREERLGSAGVAGVSALDHRVKLATSAESRPRSVAAPSQPVLQSSSLSTLLSSYLRGEHTCIGRTHRCVARIFEKQATTYTRARARPPRARSARDQPGSEGLGRGRPCLCCSRRSIELSAHMRSQILVSCAIDSRGPPATLGPPRLPPGVDLKRRGRNKGR